MTHLAIETEGPPALAKSASVSVRRLTLIISAILLASFVIQLPTDPVADWKRFAFYDQGSSIKGYLLLQKGLVPTVDFGYTHGLLSLLYSRLGYGLLGVSAWAYLLLNLLPQFVMGGALARILARSRTTRAGRAVFLCAIPFIISPSSLTLAHALECMLLILALMDQIDNRLGRALVWLTLGLFVKPGMPYLYGLVIVVMIVWRHRLQPRRMLMEFFPATITAVVTAALLACWMGIGPLRATILPGTAAQTYAQTEFGFFTASGRRFWVFSNPHATSFPGIAWEAFCFYFYDRPGIYLIAVATSLVAAGAVLWRRARNVEQWSSTTVALVTVSALNFVFLVAFYGSPICWTYYVFMPMFALAWALSRRQRNPGLAAALIVIISLGHYGAARFAWSCWTGKTIGPVTGYMWTWGPGVHQIECLETLTGAGTADARPTLVLALGTMPGLPQGWSTLDAWFPVAGIPTRSELARIRSQVDAADFVLVPHYQGHEDIWNYPEIKSAQGQFEEVQTDATSLIRAFRRVKPATRVTP